jgi:hypothetical protein
MSTCTQLATSNRSGLLYVVEVSCVGDEPAAPYDLQYINQTSNSFNLTQENVQSETIRADRQRDELVNVSNEAGGNFTGEARYAEYDDFIEGALFNNYSNQVVVSAVSDLAFVDTSGVWTIETTTTDWNTLNLDPGQRILLTTTTGDNAGIFKVSETVAITSAVLTLESVGDFTVEAAGDDYNIYASRRLVNGIVRKSFTMVKSHEDIEEFFVFNGMMVNQMTITIEQGSIPTFEFDMVGTAGRRELAFPNGAGDELAAATNPIFNPTSNIIGLSIDGVPADLVQSFSMTINNNLEAQFALGSRDAVDVTDGSVEVTGTFTLFFQDGAEFNKFFLSQASSIEFQIQDNAGNIMILEIPNYKYQSFTTDVTGINELVQANATFTASIDPTLGITVSIDAITA